MENKRKHTRIKKKIKSEVHSSEGITLSSTADISNGGIFITTPEPLETGSQVDLQLYLPGEEPVKLKGIVVWKRDNEMENVRTGMGIEFLHLSRETTDKISKILS